MSGFVPIAVTIAGSDSGGGAGIQADLKTFSALGVYGASVITALTAQNTLGVQGIHDVPAEFVSRQIDSVFSDLAVRAVKIGMLSRTAVIAAVADGLARHAGAIPVVLDPVMVATSGDRLIADEAVAALRDRLLPRADLITPNLPEAAVLLGEAMAEDSAAAVAQARRLVALGARAVLIKGGHGQGRESIDHLVTADGTLRTLAAPRIATANTHGTGGTLSAAVAAGLASGLPLPEAVAGAKDYLTAARAAADTAGVPMVINARTDGFYGGGNDASFAQTVSRGNAYLEAGASCVFVPFVRDAKTIGSICLEITGPVNILAGALSPPLPELQELGVARVSIGGLLSLAAATVLRRAAEELRDHGTYAFANDLITHPEMNGLLA